MKRWEYIPSNGGDCTSMMEQSPWGEYVLYSDHITDRAADKPRIETLEKELANMERRYRDTFIRGALSVGEYQKRLEADLAGCDANDWK